jgi:hypothetical protein
MEKDPHDDSDSNDPYLGAGGGDGGGLLLGSEDEHQPPVEVNKENGVMMIDTGLTGEHIMCGK